MGGAWVFDMTKPGKKGDGPLTPPDDEEEKEGEEK
jgi:hypothetical protein